MANLNTTNFNQFKPGLLNIATTDTPLSQGLPTNGTTVFVEDGNGLKSGLKVGVELVEAIEPTTLNGVVTVSYGDRTYASITDVRTIAASIDLYRQNITNDIDAILQPLTTTTNDLTSTTNDLASRIASLEETTEDLTDQNLNVRLTDIENNYVSRFGATVEGNLTFAAPSATTGAILNMNSNQIEGLPEAQSNRAQAASKGYVDDQIELLRQELLALINP